MKETAHYRALPRRFRRPTLLLVGCGDVGGRIGTLLARHGHDRLRVIGTTRGTDGAARLRALGIVPLRADLDDAATLARLRAFAQRMIDLAPPPNTGATDPRSARLVAALAGGPAAPGPSGSGRVPPARRGLLPGSARVVQVGRRGGLGAAARRAPVAGRARWVYVSTTGVYGDCGGAQFDETRAVQPANARAVRRVDAERRFRSPTAWRTADAALLRVPGIYAHDRLPIERLHKGLPALAPADDVYTNHIHADDLARIAWRAVLRGRAGRVVHAVDDTDLRMGDYFDRVADAFGLPRPPRVDRQTLTGLVTPMMLSFMSESRRLENRRLKRELGVRLRFPDVEATLRDCLSTASHIPGNR